MEIEQAKAACVSCADRADCLAGAIERGEKFGVWGGVDFENEQLRLEGARFALACGSVLRFEAELEELEGPWEPPPPPERQHRAGRRCSRCGSWIQAGKHPEDKNGPNATCGKPSTYNGGCRCLTCLIGKSRYSRAGA